MNAIRQDYAQIERIMLLTRKLGPVEKIVWNAMRLYDWSVGSVHPSLETLCEDINACNPDDLVDIETVRRATKKLEKVGLITQETIKRSGQRSFTRYIMNDIPASITGGEPIPLVYREGGWSNTSNKQKQEQQQPRAQEASQQSVTAVPAAKEDSLCVRTFRESLQDIGLPRHLHDDQKRLIDSVEPDEVLAYTIPQICDAYDVTDVDVFIDLYVGGKDAVDWFLATRSQRKSPDAANIQASKYYHAAQAQTQAHSLDDEPPF